MAVSKITQINLRPVQEFTGDRMMQAQRYNRSVRSGIACGLQQMRVVTHRTLLAGMGLGGLAYDGVRRTLADGWEYFEKAQMRGEELEEDVAAQLSDGVHKLETQASDELRKLRVQLPTAPTLPALRGRRVVSKPLDWTVRRISIRTQPNGHDHGPLPGYDELTAQAIIELAGELDAEALQQIRAYEAGSTARVAVLRAVDAELRKKLAVM